MVGVVYRVTLKHAGVPEEPAEGRRESGAAEEAYQAAEEVRRRGRAACVVRGICARGSQVLRRPAERTKAVDEGREDSTME